MIVCLRGKSTRISLQTRMSILIFIFILETNKIMSGRNTLNAL